MQFLKLFFYFLLMTGCAHIPDLIPGNKGKKILRNAQFTISHAGRIKIYAYPDIKNFRCTFKGEVSLLNTKRIQEKKRIEKLGNRAKIWHKERLKVLKEEITETKFPSFFIKDTEGRYFEGISTCSDDRKHLVISFKDSIPAQTYKIGLESKYSDYKVSTGEILIVPDKKNQAVGANSIYQGANDLKDGTNNSELKQSMAYSWEWWKLKVSNDERASVLFYHDSDHGNLQALIYKLGRGRLHRISFIRKKRPMGNLRPGHYYIKVFSKNYAYSSKYELIINKENIKKKVVSHGQTILNILDRYQIGKNKMAVIFELDTEATELNEGDRLEIHELKGRNYTFNNECFVKFIDKRQGECHVGGVIKDYKVIQLRRRL